MSSEEEYIDDEYIDDEYIDESNDPFEVKEITEDDYDVVIDEKIVDFDEVFESVRCKITDLVNHDHSMEKKVLDSLQRGTLK
jgi:hypothetical protein